MSITHLRRPRPIAAVFITLLLLACSTSNPIAAATTPPTAIPPTPTVEPTPTPVPTALVFQSDFSRQPESWQAIDEEQEAFYEDGRFLLPVGEEVVARTIEAQLANSSMILTLDTQLTTSTSLLPGLFCRRSEMGFYSAMKTPLGFDLLKREDGGSEVLVRIEWPWETGVFNPFRSDDEKQALPEPDRVHYRLDCQGPRISFYVDEKLIMRAEDNSFTVGASGFMAAVEPGIDSQQLALHDLTLYDLDVTDQEPLPPIKDHFLYDYDTPDTSQYCTDPDSTVDSELTVICGDDFAHAVATTRSLPDDFEGWRSKSGTPFVAGGLTLDIDFLFLKEGSSFGFVTRSLVVGSEHHTYYLLVHSRGSFEVLRHGEGGNEQGYESLLNGHDFNDWWSVTDALNPTGEWNHLRVEVSGASFHFYLNGQLLTSVTDESPYALTYGGSGIVLGHFLDRYSEVQIDNYEIRYGPP